MGVSPKPGESRTMIVCECHLKGAKNANRKEAEATAMRQDAEMQLQSGKFDHDVDRMMNNIKA